MSRTRAARSCLHMNARELVQALCKVPMSLVISSRVFQLTVSSVEFPADAVSTFKKGPHVEFVESNQLAKTQ